MHDITSLHSRKKCSISKPESIVTKRKAKNWAYIVDLFLPTTHNDTATSIKSALPGMATHADLGTKMCSNVDAKVQILQSRHHSILFAKKREANPFTSRATQEEKKKGSHHKQDHGYKTSMQNHDLFHVRISSEFSDLSKMSYYRSTASQLLCVWSA